MQKIVCIALLACCLAGGGGLFAQSAVPGPFSGKTPLRDSLHLSPLPDPPAAGIRGITDEWRQRKLRQYNSDPGATLLPFRDSVRIMSPDKMRCRVADLTKLEKMPVLWLQNNHPRDPMPNSLSRVPVLVPFRKLPPGE